MKRLIATIDENFAQIDQMLKELRHQIALAAETVHLEAEKTSKKVIRRTPRRRAAKRR